MVAAPVVTPVTTPPATVAIAVLLLLHVPPDALCVSAIPMPTHMLAGPLIAAGAAITVTDTEVAQPAAEV